MGRLGEQQVQRLWCHGVSTVLARSGIKTGGEGVEGWHMADTHSRRLHSWGCCQNSSTDAHSAVRPR